MIIRGYHQTFLSTENKIAENNTLFGGDGDDYLFGGDGEDILNAGEGNGTWQNVNGEAGDDTYIYEKSHGNVFIGVDGETSSSGINDRVILQDLTLNDISVAYNDYGIGSPEGNALSLQWSEGANSGELRIAQEGQYADYD